MRDSRLSKLRGLLSAKRLDALLVTDIPNVFYLTGFTGDTGAALVTWDACHVLVDPRFTIQARAQCPGSQIVEYTGKPGIAAAAELINDLRPARVGYEADELTVLSYRGLRSRVPHEIGLRATKGLVQQLRRIKDAHEVQLIKKAAVIADAAFDALLREIRPGMTEREVALLVDCSLRRLGADKEAFDTIAAFGPNAACPHASPTDARLQAGGLLKLDFGARRDNYNSDITRTVSIGQPTARQREVYEIVLEAQHKAIAAIQPGKPGKEIDSIARDFIASAGYGNSFGHGLGHALGILVHDGPALSQTSDVVLEPGMVVTVEPGIYIEGWGGIRIEDDVLVTASGSELLTHSTKELIGI